MTKDICRPDEGVREEGARLSPLKSIEVLEDEFSEWIFKFGLPSFESELLEKFLFFCRIKGEAKNL